MENNQDVAMAALMGAMNEGGEQPIEQQAVVPEVAPGVDPLAQTVVPEAVAPQPEIPMELQALLSGQNQLTQTVQAMQEQMTSNQPQVPLTEEEASVQQLKEMLGLSDASTQTQDLQNMVQNLQNQMNQQQVTNEIAVFKAERPNANEAAIGDYMAKLPPHMQQSMDNPAGWRMIDDLLTAQTQPQVNSDQIIPSQTVTGQQPNAINQLQQGESPSKVDIGSALLQAAGQV